MGVKLSSLRLASLSLPLHHPPKMLALRRLATPSRAFSTSSLRSAVSPEASVPATQDAKPSALTEHRPEGGVVQAGVVSGAPDELHRRPVRIFRPAVPSTSSAKGTSMHWRVDWDILQGGGRWENPLMGWASSADYVQGTHVKFNTKEDAIHFCEKQGKLQGSAQ